MKNTRCHIDHSISSLLLIFVKHKTRRVSYFSEILAQTLIQIASPILNNTFSKNESIYTFHAVALFSPPLQSRDTGELLACLDNYAAEADAACDSSPFGDSSSSRADGLQQAVAVAGGSASSIRREERRQSCVNAALRLSHLLPTFAAAVQCRYNPHEESCLRRYHYRFEHRYYPSTADLQRRAASDR